MTTKIDQSLSTKHFAVATDVLKLLADDSRLRIVWALLHGEHSVNELAEHVGISASTVSQHLSKLKAAGLVISRREGNFIFYACLDPHVRALGEQALSYSEHVIDETTHQHPATASTQRMRRA